MTREEVKDKVIMQLGDLLSMKPEDIAEEELLVADLGLDSLDQVELIMGLEETFGFDIPDEDTDKIKTVADIIDYVHANMPKG
jgi:acyl carrier protein